MKGEYVKTSLLLAVTFVCVVSCTNKASNNTKTPQPQTSSGVVSCTKKTSNNTVNGHEFVDLGLSVMWATCNVGASSPSEYGDYFAWGEIEPKSEYTEENSVTYKKYMGSIADDPQYDAARANWGDPWRLPTKYDIEELKKKCELTLITQDGVKGYKVTGPNGNSIFLPIVGWRNVTSLYYAGEFGGYWSATPDNVMSHAYDLYLGSGGIFRLWGSRYNGLSVRPVISTIISEPTDHINGHGYVDLGLSVMWATCNIGASSPFDYGDYYAWGETKTKSEYTAENNVTNEKNMGSIADNPQYDAARANWGGTWRMPTNDEIGELIDKCKWKWTTFGEKNGYKVTGSNGNSIFLPAAGWRSGSSLYDAGEDGNYWSATPDSVTSHAYNLYLGGIFRLSGFHYNGLSVRPVNSTIISEPTDYINGYGYVDLGLSVKWATCNIGASSPFDYGDYFAWGETEPKSEYTYENSVTTEKNMGSIAGNPRYDAACANWGGTWRLPTADEMEELIDKCKWKWTTFGEKNGYKVTGSNGNSIFLPAAGCREGTSLGYAGEYGSYWSATENLSHLADGLDFDGDSFFRFYGDYRYYGMSVRPVSE